ncbi:hypothetical protein PHMEG_00010489 [Phytophthora megakarya]|uniref:Uncharacterized protein n=1 Tax=Phytophthora megakarya TaxID=4795 RepID=A0A225WFL1_9STRA|nr:hypothetical protein PHMEG_00010489 [Phytophthora megakarya]
MLPQRHFAPDHVCIPGRQQTRQYNIADVDPWVIQRINTLTIMTMTLEVLFCALPVRPEWIFPSHVPRVATHRSDQYCSHLITGQNVRDLMAALPWNVLTGRTFPSPCLNTRFPVSPALIRSDPYLALFVVERKNHLATILDRYARGLCPGIEARSANLADPQLRCREPADLIEALAECDAANPWRTRYRLHHAGHPDRRITRLAGKFFNMAALNPNAPPFPPQS